MFLIFNPHSQSITFPINCGRLDQEGQSVKAWTVCRSCLCVVPGESPKRKTATMKVMIPAALLHLPGLFCLNRYHLSPFVKERRNYWVTGLVSLPKGLKASKWHFLSKGQGWHRLIWNVVDASNQHVKMPGLKCQSLLGSTGCSSPSHVTSLVSHVLVEHDACLGFQLFVLLSLPQ